MPIFEYVCRECDHQFETIVLGSQRPQCPKCEGRKLDQQLSKFAVGSERSGGPSPATGGCGSCGDPRGPGSCAMN